MIDHLPDTCVLDSVMTAPPRGHGDGLNSFKRRGFEPAKRVDLVEDFSNDVERRRAVRPADAKENPDPFADLGLQRVKRRQRPDGAVEDEIFRAFLKSISTLISALPCWP
jgi:hypothetical protein